MHRLVRSGLPGQLTRPPATEIHTSTGCACDVLEIGSFRAQNFSDNLSIRDAELASLSRTTPAPWHAKQHRVNVRVFVCARGMNEECAWWLALCWELRFRKHSR